MKKSALFVLFTLISVAGFSQITGWNAKVGMNISNLTTDGIDAKVGFRVGVGTEYAFNEMFSLQPSLFFSTKGGKVGSGELGGISAKVTMNEMYLELPVLGAARFNVANNTNLVISAGPYLAYGVGGKTKMKVKSGGEEVTAKFNTFGDVDKITVKAGGNSQDISISELENLTGSEIDAKGLNRFDFGLGVGIALEYNKFIFGLDGQFGLIDISDTETAKNINFSIGVGYKF